MYVRIWFNDIFADVDEAMPVTVGTKHTKVVAAGEVKKGDWLIISPRAYGFVDAVEINRSQPVNT